MKQRLMEALFKAREAQSNARTPAERAELESIIARILAKLSEL